MPDLVNPLIPFTVLVVGDSTSVAGDIVRVTAYNGSTARGTATGVLDSGKAALIEMANAGVSVQAGDRLVATVYGSGIAGGSVIVSGDNAEFNFSTVAVTFPSRSL